MLRRLLELGGERKGERAEGTRDFVPSGDTPGICPAAAAWDAPVPIGCPVLTPSFLSLSSAPCRKSRDTSSFSSSHWITKGSNQLEETHPR